MKDLYESTYSTQVQQETFNRASSMYDQLKQQQQQQQHQHSRLAGVQVAMNHNNMQPYYRGEAPPKETDGFQTRLDTFTGTNPFYKKKRETEFMGDRVPDSGNVYGMTGTYILDQERMITSAVRNNELPFQQEKVGPGLNVGFNSKPTGGFQQDLRAFTLPRSVDELRTINNPKLTYEGRVVDGQQEVKRGSVGEVYKNRVDTYYESGADRLFTTVGDVVKPATRPEQVIRDVTRPDTSTDYAGHAYDSVAQAPTKRATVQAPHRPVLNPLDVGSVKVVSGSGSKDDYGKGTILVYGNERDVTTTRTYQGNFTHAIKALIAPLLDIARGTTKEYLTAAPRTYGHMNGPSRLPVYDPEDVARTTQKETLEDAPRTYGHMGANERVPVYDPDDVARTTQKETLADAPRTYGHMGANERVTVYDPEDVARTTIKETIIHDTHEGFLNPSGAHKVKAALEDGARTTTRQTLPEYENSRAIRGSIRSVVYDPDDIARRTMKETIVDDDHVGGINGERQGAGYLNASYDMKNTQKQFTSDNDYTGTAYSKVKERGGYESASYDAKNTQKQFTSDNDYYGAGKAEADKSMSYDDAYNAEVNEHREKTLERRQPSKQGAKVSVGGEAIRLDSRKMECDVAATREAMGVNYVYSAIPSAVAEFTRDKISTPNDDRLDPGLLRAFKENPFTQSLSSF